MVNFAVVSFLIAYEVKEGNKGFAAHFVYEFTLPKKHDMLLILYRSFLKTVLLSQVNILK